MLGGAGANNIIIKPKKKTLKKKKKLIIITNNNNKNKNANTPKMEPLKPNPPYNKAFIAILEKLGNIMMSKGEFMRGRAYQKAVESLLSVEGPINSADDIKDLKGIGKTIVEKFKEFVETGTLAVLEREKNNPLLIFSQVYGIGPKKAKELVDKGIKTIEELRANKGLLNDKQLLGLEYYEDILKRIPRAEIEEYEKHFAGVFAGIKSKNPKATFSIVGSYRRGATDSGDIDVILTDGDNDASILPRFLDALSEKKIILHKLTDGKTKVLVIAQLPGKPARRVDFLYSSPTEFPFAQLYFTGSKTFNTLMRQRALDMGYTLNEHGIYHMVSGKKGSLVDHKFESERDIFSFLKMQYKQPKSRLGAEAIVEEVTEAKKETKETKKESKKETKSKSKKKLIIMDSESGEKGEKEKKEKKIVNSSKTHLKNFQKKGAKYLDELNKSVLKKALLYAVDLYYNEPEKVFLTDNEFDVIKEYYDNKFEPFDQIGAPIKQDKVKVALPFPMPSMDKIKPSTGALDRWLTKYNDPGEYVISGKLDGVSGLYVIKDGERKLYTRGDGEYGQDISGLIPYLKLPVPSGTGVSEVVIRGEFIISKENFEKHFKGTGAKNARNTVSGIIGRKTINPENLKLVDFVTYELMKPEMKISEQLDYISKMDNANVVKHKKVKGMTLTNSYLSEQLVDFRNNYKYETDGVIVAHDKLYQVRKNKNPEHAFAFKMVVSDQVVEAKVVDVIWTPSKDGYLKPRVRIEPVDIGGVTIEYATGFNGAFIEKNKIGVGALIELVRSGDVIPDIKKVVVPAAEPLMPDVPYVWNKTHVDVMLAEENKAKDPIVKAKNITGFFKVLETDGLSSGTVDKLIAAGYDDVCKIIRITNEDLLKFDGFKEKRASKIHNAISEALSKASPILIMKASNVFGRGFGERRMEPIFDHYPDVLVSKESDAEKIKKVIEVPGIAKLTATAFVEKIPKFMKFIKDCGLEDRFIGSEEKGNKEGNKEGNKGNKEGNKGNKEGNKGEKKAMMIVPEKKGDPNHPLYGKNVMFTGFRPKELMAAVKDVGAKIGSSVSKNTFVLVVKDKDEDSGKITKAKELGIPLMTEEEFREKYMK